MEGIFTSAGARVEIPCYKEWVDLNKEVNLMRDLEVFMSERGINLNFINWQSLNLFLLWLKLLIFGSYFYCSISKYKRLLDWLTSKNLMNLHIFDDWLLKKNNWILKS